MAGDFFCQMLGNSNAKKMKERSAKLMRFAGDYKQRLIDLFMAVHKSSHQVN